MKPFFFWDDERIRFFDDAASYGDYYDRLANALAPWLQPDDHVLDAGCGLGYLSQALSPYCAQVTALDQDPLAIESLRLRNTCQSVHPVCADAFSYAAQCDTLVCCRFGGADQALALKAHFRAQTLLLVTRQEAHHRFSDSTCSRRRTVATACAILDAAHVPYTQFSLELPFDQPFRSLSDATAFFQSYRGDDTAASVTADAAAKRLQTTGDATFPYLLPVTNRLGVLVVKE